ncbi:hypothetical protein KK083_21750 [Fulvivirgaceae bacterium PWU4]|uniref:Bacterial surface antigen (D15) domain-containing protein n=1 Tax=Chryseosolibacter histidini TaxID=2782349 RepID=A0AAP2DQL7_9BACT|nr:hypothetical protein [Chryseosolibacter histidini]MBT1699538.1 hypothetical protein [Chryseosolibacter histidini]
MIVISSMPAAGQPGEEQDSMHFKDSLDHAFDLSNFLIDAHGFLPLPFVITEPALGNFGGGLALVFLKRRPPISDTVSSKVRVKQVPPDITGGGGLYTLNNSWAAMAFRLGTWARARSKYRVLGGYADLNLSFYRDTDEGEEKEFRFKLRTTPFFSSFQKNFAASPWSAGISYLFLNTDAELQSEDLPEFLDGKEWSSRVSMPGIVVEMDNRDNIFTPNRGMYWRLSTGWSDNGFGSEYDYVNLNSFFHFYTPLWPALIAGFRYEMQEVFGDAPFYLLPYLNLRGVPVARYQGNIYSVVEVELRWDFVPRWSLVGFGGTGKVYDEWNTFSKSPWTSSGGGGFRYLVARKFKLRMGLDLAKGPEQWAYYVVLGSAWFR